MAIDGMRSGFYEVLTALGDLLPCRKHPMRMLQRFSNMLELLAEAAICPFTGVTE